MWHLIDINKPTIVEQTFVVVSKSYEQYCQQKRKKKDTKTYKKNMNNI